MKLTPDQITRRDEYAAKHSCSKGYAGNLIAEEDALDAAVAAMSPEQTHRCGALIDEGCEAREAARRVIAQDAVATTAPPPPAPTPPQPAEAEPPPEE